MIVDVVDIRKRIQQVRNEVSDALLARREAEPYQDETSDLFGMQFDPGQEQAPISEALPEPVAAPATAPSKAALPEQTKRAHRAATDALSMPSFTLNVTNRHSSTLLIGLIAMQLITNVILVAVLILT